MIKSLNRNNKVHCEVSGTPDVIAWELKCIFENLIQNHPEILNGVMLALESNLKESIEVIDPKKTMFIYYMLGGAPEDDRD